MIKIEPFIHQKVVVLHQDDTAGQAARAMKERHIGCVIVADHEGHIVGIVTDRDLALELLGNNGDPSTPLSEIMTRDLATVDQDADIGQVLKLMEERGVRRIPVVHQEGGKQKCLGLVTLDDLIASKSIDYYALMRIVRSQVLRRIGPRQSAAKPVGPKLANPFYQMIYEKISPKARLTRTQAEQFSKLIFESLVRRLHHTGAMHLISQFPEPLKQEMLEIPAGPDTTVTVPRLVDELNRRFTWDDATSYMALTRFCMTLEEVIDHRSGHRELEQVKAQLPQDFKNLFATRAKSDARKMKVA